MPYKGGILGYRIPGDGRNFSLMISSIKRVRERDHEVPDIDMASSSSKRFRGDDEAIQDQSLSEVLDELQDLATSVSRLEKGLKKVQKRLKKQSKRLKKQDRKLLEALSKLGRSTSSPIYYTPLSSPQVDLPIVSGVPVAPSIVPTSTPPSTPFYHPLRLPLFLFCPSDHCNYLPSHP